MMSPAATVASAPSACVLRRASPSAVTPLRSIVSYETNREVPIYDGNTGHGCNGDAHVRPHRPQRHRTTSEYCSPDDEVAPAADQSSAGSTTPSNPVISSPPPMVRFGYGMSMSSASKRSLTDLTYSARVMTKSDRLGFLIQIRDAVRQRNHRVNEANGWLRVVQYFWVFPGLVRMISVASSMSSS